MAISVTYEFIEWTVSLGTGEGGDSFFGIQGYTWDAQSDMLCASIGAIIALVLFGKDHTRQIKELIVNLINEISVFTGTKYDRNRTQIFS